MKSFFSPRDELLEYILSFRPRHQECREYYISHMKRVMMRLDFISHFDRSLRILEIGAPPFNTTLALRKIGFNQIDCSGYDEGIRDDNQEVRTVEEKLYSPSLDKWEYFRVSYFDVEKDRWPFPDESYDMVMGFEILEHLSKDPLHMLSEANRVTRTGGYIFLTTPNIASLRNIVRLIRIRTPGECPFYRPAKAQGARHNREWTPVEVKAALRAAGYDVVKLETKSLLEPHKKLSCDSLIVKIVKILRLRGDSIFVMARKATEVRERFPTDANLYYHWDNELNNRLLDQTCE